MSSPKNSVHGRRRTVEGTPLRTHASKAQLRRGRNRAVGQGKLVGKRTWAHRSGPAADQLNAAGGTQKVQTSVESEPATD